LRGFGRNMNHKRNCPDCGKELTYSTKTNLNKAIRKNRLCRPCIQKGNTNGSGNKGRKHSEETRKKQSVANGGSGILNNHLNRSQLGTWSKDVKKKDNKRCVYCGSTNKLHAHHILAKSKHPEWALFIDNGITLCEPCHIQEHKLNGYI